ncbi:MAG: porin family protein [Bacteroidales bacterium]|nr:porin family protein [Bacteroidales bacterium]
MIKYKFFLILFCFPLLISSQNFKGGIIAGMSASQISGDKLTGFYKAAPIFGGFTRLNFNEKNMMEFDLYYIGKGSHKTIDTINFEFYTLKLGYIEALFLYRYRIKYFFLEGGVSFAVLTNSSEEFETGIYKPGVDRPAFNKFDYNFHVGLGYPIGKKIIFSARFSRSLMPVRGQNLNGGQPRLERLQFNSATTFTFSYQFGK